MKRLVWLVLAAIFLQGAAAQQGPEERKSGTPLAALVGAEYADALVRDGKLSSFQSRDPRPSLAPFNAYIRNMANELIRSLKPGFFAENLFLYRKPESRAGKWSQAEQTALYNETLALSSLAGLQYYSPSRGEPRTFYETSVVVSGPDGKTALSDPFYAVPPADLSIYARQKDLSFGDNVYRYEYHIRPDVLVFVQENVTAMNYGIIPAIGKNKLRSMVAVLDADEYLVVYAVSMAKAAALPGMTEKVGRSFSSRADAVLKWFSEQAGKAFTKTGLP